MMESTLPGKSSKIEATVTQEVVYTNKTNNSEVAKCLNERPPSPSEGKRSPNDDIKDSNNPATEIYRDTSNKEPLTTATATSTQTHTTTTIEEVAVDDESNNNNNPATREIVATSVDDNYINISGEYPSSPESTTMDKTEKTKTETSLEPKLSKEEKEVRKELVVEQVYQDKYGVGEEFEFDTHSQLYESDIVAAGSNADSDTKHSRASKLIELLTNAPIGHIRVTVVEASFLKKIAPHQIPQVKFTFDKITLKSNGITTGGISPQWDIRDPRNTLKLPVFNPLSEKDVVAVEVRDYNDQLIGAGSILSLQNLSSAQVEVKLELIDDKSDSAGIMTFLIAYEKSSLKHQADTQRYMFLSTIPRKIVGFCEQGLRGLNVYSQRVGHALVETIKSQPTSTWIALFLLILPYLFVSVISDYSFATRFWFFAIPVMLYIQLHLPHLLGKALGGIIRAIALHGYDGGFNIETVHFKPWLREGRFHFMLIVEGCAFGNPNGFPFENFFSLGRLSIQASTSYGDIMDCLFFRLKPCKLKNVSDFSYLAVLDFQHIEAEDIMLNFQLYDEKLNINEFTEIIAKGEGRDRGIMKGFFKEDEQMPNQLEIRVIRARGLRAESDDGNRLFDPYVIVRIRRDKKITKNQSQTREPMFNEQFYFNIDQFSAVIVVEVWNRVPIGKDELLGQWRMTLKWMVGDPYYCWHEKGLEVTPERLMRGWFPLMNKSWRGLGRCGSIEMQMQWKYVPKHELREKADFPAQTALEQLTENSEETLLRVGDIFRVRHWLYHTPILLDARRFTMRNVKFYLQDLFRGYKGKAETKGKADYVHVDRLEYFTEFRPEKGELGITAYDFIYNFMTALAPKLFQAASGAQVGGAISQITFATLVQLGEQWRNFFEGRFERVGVVQSMKNASEIGHSIDVSVQHLQRVVAQRTTNKGQYKYEVSADDTDFLVEYPSISGHLDRTANELPRVVNGEVPVNDLATMVKGKGNGFKRKYLELKNQTLFYKRQKAATLNALFNVTYKIDLRTVTVAYHFHSDKEIVLVHQRDGYLTRLRNPSAPFLITNTTNDPSLSEWFEAIRLAGVKCVDMD